MTLKVKCNTCGNEFLPLFGNISNQGIGCDCDVDFLINRIKCHFGSKYDGHIYEFIDGNIPDFVESGLICDACMLGLIDEQYIKLILTGVI